MIFFARTENEFGKRETVQHHLIRCAELARTFAERFKCGAEGEILCLFHDFGKYSTLFQKVLDRKESRINHEAAGATIIKKLYGNNGSTLARIIYAHHKGLEYDIDTYLNDTLTFGSFDKDNRRNAISGSDEYKNSFDIFRSEIIIPNIKITSYNHLFCRNKKLEEMLFLRFLFSCLVDADYSSSAEHFDKDYLEKNCSSFQATPLTRGRELKHCKPSS